ncbi:hypothetical protein LXA43DRAFT_1097183 [Ganoderma leucocontextum]|nr:hypothetical protein LXA43DRAFT_1097183 [Ganoderma leucocontextum]
MTNLSADEEHALVQYLGREVLDDPVLQGLLDRLQQRLGHLQAGGTHYVTPSPTLHPTPLSTLQTLQGLPPSPLQSNAHLVSGHAMLPNSPGGQQIVFALNSAAPHARSHVGTLNNAHPTGAASTSAGTRSSGTNARTRKRKSATGSGDPGGVGGGGGDPDRALWICNRGAVAYKRVKRGNGQRALDVGDHDEPTLLRWIVADQPFIPDDPKALSLLQQLAQGFESNMDSKHCRTWVNNL